MGALQKMTGQDNARAAYTPRLGDDEAFNALLRRLVRGQTLVGSCERLAELLYQAWVLCDADDRTWLERFVDDVLEAGMGEAGREGPS